MASQVLLATESPAPGHPSIACRIYERLTCEMPTTCQPASALAMKEMRWSAIITDISQGGVRVKLQRRFERGTGLAIEMPGDAQRESAVVFVKVRHVKAQDDGTWALGCKFISELSDDEVQRLITSDEYVLSSAKDNEVVEPEANEKFDDESTAGTPVNVTFLTDVLVEIDAGRKDTIRCSIKRLDVSKCWPMSAGKAINISGKAKDGTVWSMKIEVIELRRHEPNWHLRTRLAQPASASGLKRVLGRLDGKQP